VGSIPLSDTSEHDLIHSYSTVLRYTLYSFTLYNYIINNNDTLVSYPPLHSTSTGETEKYTPSQYQQQHNKRITITPPTSLPLSLLLITLYIIRLL